MTVEERKEAVKALVEAVREMPTRELKIKVWDKVIPAEVRATDPALEILFHFTTNEEFANKVQNFVFEKCQKEV